MFSYNFIASSVFLVYQLLFFDVWLYYSLVLSFCFSLDLLLTFYDMFEQLLTTIDNPCLSTVDGLGIVCDFPCIVVFITTF